jgi:hypothetical protein
VQETTVADDTKKILEAIAELKSEMATAASLAALARKVDQIAGDVAYLKENFLGANDIIELRRRSGGGSSGMPQAAKGK